MSSRIFYVYKHVDPATNEVVYVGTGSFERAWNVRLSSSRRPKHYAYLRRLVHKGKVPSEWVRVVQKGMLRADALVLEKRLIDKHSPKFNILGSKSHKWSLKLTPAQRRRAHTLRKKGLSYIKIAKDINSSAMTVHRLLNGKTKGYIVD